jgi:hypothetical protein
MPMKLCGKCETLKLETEFAFKNKAKGLLQSYCKECQKDYAKSHYAKDVAYYVEKAQRRRQRKASFIREAREVPCADCGGIFPFYMMEFDHKEPSLKDFNVASMSNNSWAEIRAEIEKCDVVCANHHRERTYLRR